MNEGFLLLLCVNPRSIKESCCICVESMDQVVLFVVLRAWGLPHWVFSRVLLFHWAGLDWLVSLFK